jgi:hypothetical protein
MNQTTTKYIRTIRATTRVATTVVFIRANAWVENII